MKKYALIISSFCMALLSCALLFGARHVPPSRPAYSPISSPSPVIALTFDDGPHPQYTDMILDVLEENNARGTFFIIGELINDGMPQLERIIGGGHQIGNHTWGHKELTRLSPWQINRQIMSVYESIFPLFGVGPELVRPPYGYHNEAVRQNAGFPLIHWSVDTTDWDDKNPERICAQILENVRDGDIILMHDTYASTAEAVTTVVPELRSRGYVMVTVSEMFALKGKELSAGRVYFSASDEP